MSHMPVSYKCVHCLLAKMLFFGLRPGLLNLGRAKSSRQYVKVRLYANYSKGVCMLIMKTGVCRLGKL